MVPLHPRLSLPPPFCSRTTLHSTSSARVLAVFSTSRPPRFPQLSIRPKPKPKWDVHLPGVGNRDASFTGVFRPLIAEWSGSGPHLIFPADQSGEEAADSLRHRLPAPQAKVPRRLRSRPSPDRLITVEVRCQGRRQEKASRRPENRLAEHRATWPIIAVIGHVDREQLCCCRTPSCQQS